MLQLHRADRGNKGGLLKHVKVFGAISTDAHNLCTESVKLLLVLTELSSLDCASRSASLFAER